MNDKTTKLKEQIETFATMIGVFMVAIAIVATIAVSLFFGAGWGMVTLAGILVLGVARLYYCAWRNKKAIEKAKEEPCDD